MHFIASTFKFYKLFRVSSFQWQQADGIYIVLLLLLLFRNVNEFYSSFKTSGTLVHSFLVKDVVSTRICNTKLLSQKKFGCEPIR